jgi:predicted signal transduction protein with EAL and GGDEF domain
LGHEVGDRVLREIARRLGVVTQARHFVARPGGDEFAIILEGADKRGAMEFARTILAGLREPMMLDNQRLDVDASLGVVSYPEDGASITALLRRAELAMTLAKRRHDGYAFGADVADDPPHEQLALIGEMREALLRDEFIVYFQPKMELATRRIKGAEALLRWRHPERGLVPPGRFIPFAEQTGFIRKITPWLLNAVVAHAANWPRAGLDIVASANISTLDLLNLGFVGQVRQLLMEHALPPEKLCIEITESALMDDPDLALRHLEDLAALGVKLSIDDYGSGQASLAYVKNLPVHELKVDRAFVDKVDVLPKNAAIVRSTILLCRELELTVVAEGAETQAELDWLAANDCEVVQGFGIAKPMPADEFVQWVNTFSL